MEVLVYKIEHIRWRLLRFNIHGNTIEQLAIVNQYLEMRALSGSFFGLDCFSFQYAIVF